MSSAAVDSHAVERDVMEYDVAIVGGGPAGLACAIRLKQLKPDTNICVLEKASAVGAHSLSGRRDGAGSARCAAAASGASRRLPSACLPSATSSAS